MWLFLVSNLPDSLPQVVTASSCTLPQIIIIFYMLHLVLLLLTTSMTMKRFFKIYFFFLLQINTRFKSLVKTLLWLTTMKDKLVHQGNPEDFTWLRWVRELTEQMDAKTSKGRHQCCQLNEIWEKLESNFFG